MMRARTQGSIGVSPAGATVIDKTDRIAYISVDLADKWPYILHYSRAGFDEHWPVIVLGDSEDAAYRPGPLRKRLDEAIEKVRS